MNNEHESTKSIISAAFSDVAGAESALRDLLSANFQHAEISSADLGRDAQRDLSPEVSAAAIPAQSFFNAHESAASSFADELARLGFSKHDAHDLIDSMTSGGAIVTADATHDSATAVSILRLHGGDIRYGTTAAKEQTAPLSRDAEQVLALRAECLEVEKHRVQQGEARVHKELVTHMESIDVPVTREELVVERVAMIGAGSAAPIGASEVVRIPLSEERVNVTKTTEVVGDVRIGKRLVEETAHVSESLAEERLRVTETVAPEADIR